MKLVKFYTVDDNEYMEEFFEFEDKVTDREIREALDSWLWDETQVDWDYVEDSCND